MVNHIKPLPFYQELIYYTGVITLGGIILVIYFIFGNRDSSNLMVPFLLISFVFGVVTYLIWDKNLDSTQIKTLEINNNDYTNIRVIGVTTNNILVLLLR